ncbi:hypothetical protein MtrunA17_Chr8g0387621 [Medicago truncatula]|uniref:Membrane-associated kinase regulator, putative n=1 Tax=Medicago truncatula TaxID=3880 RepID=A0A072TW97_MEDTR|nr:probable membrane-associated kinase regulator 2 isoform X1 [Medicago truncatula]KEH21158.1 membrane-associated kinase regulator, putative [Medicago truncatula]RHN43420.1 hypothetical protein MtrunA17_Chr8g0387621 [Medicago truncatula]
MEAFTLLKSWKPTAGETPQLPLPSPPPPLPATEEEDTHDIETTDEEDEGEPFFDIELTVPEEDEEEKANESDINEFRFTLSPSTNDPNLVQLELDSSEPNSKPQLTASLLKSATKFRVFISGLNKSNKSSNSSSQNPNQQPKSESQKKKLFTVKFKVDEVPFVSYFTRDNSSKGKGKTGNNKASQKQKKQRNTDESKLHSPSSDEKQRFSKEAIEKYLKKVKPLYVKVSRKYAEKLKFSGHLNTSSVKTDAAEKVEVRADPTENENEVKNVKSQKQGTLPLPLPAGLRVVCKRLGKSRSASSSTPSPEAGTVSSRRRDDSMTQQQDGIQSAILHCKSSFNSSKEEESSQHESSRKLAKDFDDEGGSLK